MHIKKISNTPEMPWLDLLKSGVKTVEGRIRDPESLWSKIEIGEIINFYTDTNQDGANFQVRGLVYASDFDELDSLIGDKLIPSMIRKDGKSANEIYEEVLGVYNPEWRTKMLKYGVVGVVVIPV
jgi:ASC-1-like (ASCH) protein